ncbi:keratin-associated protein 27-1 [Nycticebus coucang]|uniref:keratin-associated protein 27-1 n=1 Tax=Nycticebus coucang TaxID=9470 RepID=UPI00234C077F|nr:keratin-associated protein 27-1 [Nycticebus coucang]
MPCNHYHSLGSSQKAPLLSAIVHGSNPISLEDGLCLPSSYYSRTWFLNNFQETCNETTISRPTSCEQKNLFTEDSHVQSTCLPGVVQMTYSDPGHYERTTHQLQSTSAVLEHTSQPCQSGSSEQMGFVVPRCQPESHMEKCCPPKTSVSKSCQTLECESSQCQSQSPKSSSCKPLVKDAPETPFLESPSSTYEPTCCVTGGLKLPSK